MRLNYDPEIRVTSSALLAFYFLFQRPYFLLNGAHSHTLYKQLYAKFFVKFRTSGNTPREPLSVNRGCEISVWVCPNAQCPRSSENTFNPRGIVIRGCGMSE